MSVSGKPWIPRTAFAGSAVLAVAIGVSAILVATTPLAAQGTGASGVEAARAHAAPYADPDYYTQPAVVDIYQDIFLGRPTSQTSPSYNTGDGSPFYAAERQTVACYAGNCAPASPGRAEICASAYSGSFLKIGVGDTFYIGKLGIDGAPVGNTPDGTKAKTHTVVAVSPGTGAGNCAVGTWILTVYPWIDYIAEGVTPGASLSPVWRDANHPTGGAAYLMGYKLGSDTRDPWGVHGHNLITNPGFRGSGSSSIQGWDVSTGTLVSYPYDIGSGPTKPVSGAPCNSGEGIGYPTGIPGDDCVSTSAILGAEVMQDNAIPVTPGERYILSGLLSTGSAAAYYGLADDRDGDDVWALNPDLKVTLTDSVAKTRLYRVPRWFSSVVTIPEGVSSVRFLFRTANSGDWLDYVSMRRQTGSFDSTVATNYLMNDPGSRNVVFLGDSWFDPGPFTPYAPYFKQGLLDAFAARGISIPPGQVVFAGVGGSSTAAILDRLPDVLTTYQPLYIVLDGGINDTYFGALPDQILANFKEMARLSVQAGAIPIVLSPPPAAKLDGTPVFGTGSVFAALHTLREGLRNWVLGLDNNWCGGAGEVPIATCGEAACVRAVLACIDGVPQACIPGIPQPEICNGLDDDCNGVVDDGGGNELCDDGNVCTDDVCGGASGCSATNNADACDDGSACTSGDVCGGGACQPGSPAVCNDNNLCTTDSCNPATGFCGFANNTDACDDGNPCTTADACGGGACIPGAPAVCDDGNVCTTDSCDPGAGCVFVNNTNPCSDGNLCTTSDTCGGGACLPGMPTSCNDNNICTSDSCDPATGACVFTNNTNSCSDGNACTSGDICGNGVCQPGAPAACSDNNVCTTDTCNPATGACVFTNNTSSCSDGNPCTTGDACSGGACNGGTATVCNDNNPCTDDSCAPASGCTYTVDNGNACSDDNACTVGDTCGGGVCLPGTATTCNDGDVCTTDTCNPATGVCAFTNNTSPCSDGNPCTANDACGGGICNPGNAVTCNDNNPCTTDSCQPTTGACVFTNNTGSCSDGNACTTGDVCGGGVCQPGAPTVCDDGNACTNDSCNPSNGCKFTNDNSNTCSDGNACTTGDECRGGDCRPGTAVVCSDTNPCTTDSCNPETGCVFASNTNPCSDGNACTTGDACGGGTCNPGASTVCNDGNICTTDSCNPLTGCAFANNTNPCDDGSACTTGDVCGGGACNPGAPTACNDSNPCTTDSCNPATGCVFANNSAPCSDGNACTTGDTCGGGACNPGPPTACDDDNLCTTDSCDPATGCAFANNTNPCDDANACTTGDACGGGVCNPGAPTACNDNNRCTTDGCNPAIGCVFANNTSPCEDGNACTTGDTCSSGSCEPGTQTACNDGNACTTDSCDPATGCVYTNNSDPCDDANACTSGDTCGGGACNPGAPMACNDGNLCTTDSCDPATGCVYTNNSDPCDDANACTSGDTCGGGACNPGPPTVCNDGNVCTNDSCDSATGCAFANNTNPCDDVNACTTGDTCGGGACNPGALMVCDDGNRCTTDSCDPEIGCVFANNTVPCDDANACTTGDACGGGTCNPGAATVCNDGNPCTDDSCLPATGCRYVNDDNNACSDNNACTAGDDCKSGVCRPGSTAITCNDNNPCTTDSCNPATGCVFENNASPCNDGNACTTGDVCGGGTCNPGPPTVCNDGRPCTDDSCVPSSGCKYVNDNSNTCSDDNACTVGDNCNSGNCRSGTPVVCNDNNVCTTDSCNLATGSCTFANNTAACNDNSACTQGDVCQGGACVGVPLPVPLEVDNGVRINRSGSSRIITWNLATHATSSELLRGSVGGLPVGPGTGDETCLGSTTNTTFTDNTAPPLGGGFWYLVRGANICPTKGPWGYQSVRGLAGAQRLSTTCP